jgi:ubiquitin-like protein Pup
MSQSHAEHSRKDEEIDELESVPTEELATETGSIDDILDDIDGLLEENAEMFVAQYVQQGGQ